MAKNCPVLTPAERQIVDVITRAERGLAVAISSALEEATEQAAKEMRAIGQEQAAPAQQYFVAAVHQRIYCLLCGADPDSFEGGDPGMAYNVIRNSQTIARHYWSADIEPYPPK